MDKHGIGKASQVKMYSEGEDKIRLNAWPDKKPDVPYFHLEAQKGLGNLIDGASARYEMYVKPDTDKDSQFGTPYQQAILQQQVGDLTVQGIADMYGQSHGYGMDIGLKGLPLGLEGHVRSIENEDRGRTDSAYVYKYVPGGRLKVEASKSENSDPKYKLLFNKSF